MIAAHYVLAVPAPCQPLRWETEMQRKLAAIMAADIVGYSRLMAEDEFSTYAELRTVF